MPIFQAKTSRLKTDFIHPDFIPNSENSILTSVQLQYPQSSNVPISQVGDRDIAGNYRYNEPSVTVDFTWQTEYSEAERLFLRCVRHCQEKSGGIVLNPLLQQNTFANLTSASFRTSGLSPSQFNMTMLFINASDFFDTEFDPLEFFGVTTEESETILEITEDLTKTDFIVEENYSITMRQDIQFGIHGYRNIKFGSAILSESVSYLDSSYVPIWKYADYIHESTAAIQYNTGLTESGPRSYSASRQGHVIVVGEREVTLGW